MKFAVIGSGNVAWHYCKMWIQNGHQCLFGYSRSGDNFEKKMSDLHIPYLTLSEWDQDIDFVLLAVPDGELPALSEKIPPHLPIIYPSGSTDWEMMKSENKAVLWGIYSFIHHQEIDYTHIPYCWEASNEMMSNLVLQLMKPFEKQWRIWQPFSPTTSSLHFIKSPLIYWTMRTYHPNCSLLRSSNWQKN
jgi:hypothetical protein